MKLEQEERRTYYINRMSQGAGKNADIMDRGLQQKHSLLDLMSYTKKRETSR